MCLNLRTTLKRFRNQFRRNGSVTSVTKEAEMIISRGSTETVFHDKNAHCTVFGPASEPPTDFLRKALSPAFRHLSRLRYCTNDKGKCLFNGMVSPSGSSSSPATSFHIKALKESPNKPLSKYNFKGANARSFTVTSLTSIEDPSTRELIHQTNVALRECPPKLCALGTGGVYFIQSDDHDNDEDVDKIDADNKFENSAIVEAVFKPTDEEPGEKNNPKGYHCCCVDADESGDGITVMGLKNGIRPGEGAIRERAAYLLDYGSISGIPPTTMVILKSLAVDGDVEKIGSLQKYVNHMYDAEECGTALFPVDEVHKICLADIRFVNKDRNGQNILMTRLDEEKVILTPIDHTYCFPDSFKDIYFEWMYWPQAEQQFGPKFKKFIEVLDPEMDLDLLYHNGIELRPECIRVFLFSTYFLKWSVRHNLTPRDIAVVMTKDYEGSSSISQLENVFQAVMQNYPEHENNDKPVVELEIYHALDRCLLKKTLVV